MRNIVRQLLPFVVAGVTGIVTFLWLQRRQQSDCIP